MPIENADQKIYTNQLVVDSLTAMHTDISGLREGVSDNIKELTLAITKLVKIEEKQTYMARAYDALVRQNEKNDIKHEALETRVDTLEKDAPMQKRVTNWIITLILGVAAGAIYGALKLIGVL